MDEEWRMEGAYLGGAGTCVPAHRSPISLQKLSVTLSAVPETETDLTHPTGVFTK